MLHTTGTVHDGNMLRYRASKFDCDVCALKMQCCPNTPARQVPRDLQEGARDVARRLMRTKAFLKSRDERKRVEMDISAKHFFDRGPVFGICDGRATRRFAENIYRSFWDYLSASRAQSNFVKNLELQRQHIAHVTPVLSVSGSVLI